MQMMRKIYDYFFIIQTRIYQLEIFCSIENKSKYFASMQILQHQTSFMFLLEVKKQKKKKKYVDYFNNYCIMQTINFWSLLPANHLLLLFVYIVIVWREREKKKQISSYLARHQMGGERKWRRGTDRLYLQFRRCLSCTKERAQECMQAYTYSMRLEENETFSFPFAFSSLFNM